MLLKVVLCCFVAAVAAMPSKRGACVVMCSPSLGVFDDLNLQDCPSGTACHSNGCGATCVAVHSQTKPAHCKPVLCALYCPKGFLTDESGCDTCSCS